METKETLPLTISDDLIVEILLRLPVKSMLRFKCVCKSWLSIISNPQFAKSHFDLAAAPTHRFLKFINNFEVDSTNIDAPLHDGSAKVVFSVPFSSCASKYRRVNIVGSCRGFILLEFNFIDFVIWNPSTNLKKRINNNSFMSRPNLCGIGYDSSTDEYVVAIITLPQLCTIYFSLRTNSWSCTQSTMSYNHIEPESRQGEFLNGSLHWLVQSFDLIHMIISFDVKEKRLSNIPLPDSVANELESEAYHLKAMKGSLSIFLVCYKAKTIVYEIWMMKEYKVQSSWTKSFVFSTRFTPSHCLIYPIYFTKNGEILGLNGNTTSTKISDKSRLLKLLEYHTHEWQHGNKYDLLDCGMYRESLLSLPRNFEKPSQHEQ